MLMLLVLVLLLLWRALLLTELEMLTLVVGRRVGERGRGDGWECRNGVWPAALITTQCKIRARA
jgi:hypothetical protein